MIKIEELDLLKLIYWARRYCDNRSNYAPPVFNELYDRIVQLNPQLTEKDKFDKTLHSDGKFWPYAQDVMYNAETCIFDARPRKLPEEIKQSLWRLRRANNENKSRQLHRIAPNIIEGE